MCGLGNTCTCGIDETESGQASKALICEQGNGRSYLALC